MSKKKKYKGLNYANPYELMIGTWTGHSIMYDAKGNYLHTGPSLLYMQWKKPGKVLHYMQEDMADLDSIVLDHKHKKSLKNMIFLREFDLFIDGKSCKSKGSKVKVKGVESSPGTYLFHLNFPDGNYYNNQYFPTPNERHIIGPFIPNGETDISAVVSQTFSRISYDVPDKLLKKS